MAIRYYALGLLSFCLSVSYAGAVPAISQLPAAPEVAVPAAQPAPAFETNRARPIRLTYEDIQNADKLRKASSEMFEAYMSESGLFRPLEKVIARIKFKQVTEWTIPFLQTHADSLDLSLKYEAVAGSNRMVVLSSFGYNGHKLEFLRFRLGNDSATAVRIDGVMETEGGREKLFYTGTETDFNNFVSWFEGRLGKPGQPVAG